jgi:ethanolamine utilization protein EutS
MKEAIMADINQLTETTDADALRSNSGKLRIIQETVPGKQVTLAHIIAGPEAIVYQKLGLNPAVDYSQAAIGILSMTPYEIAIIAGDLACKTANIDIGFIDRFSGTLIFTGRISDVTSAVKAILNYLKNKLGFTICDITKT